MIRDACYVIRDTRYGIWDMRYEMLVAYLLVQRMLEDTIVAPHDEFRSCGTMESRITPWIHNVSHR
jgi:hypothetical protein